MPFTARPALNYDWSGIERAGAAIGQSMRDMAARREERKEKAKQTNQQAKAWDAVMKSSPDLMTKLGVDEETWTGLSAEDKVASGTGLLQGMGAEQALQNLKQMQQQWDLEDRRRKSIDQFNRMVTTNHPRPNEIPPEGIAAPGMVAAPDPKLILRYAAEANLSPQDTAQVAGYLRHLGLAGGEGAADHVGSVMDLGDGQRAVWTSRGQLQVLPGTKPDPDTYAQVERKLEDGTVVKTRVRQDQLNLPAASAPADVQSAVQSIAALRARLEQGNRYWGPDVLGMGDYAAKVKALEAKVRARGYGHLLDEAAAAPALHTPAPSGETPVIRWTKDDKGNPVPVR